MNDVLLTKWYFYRLLTKYIVSLTLRVPLQSILRDLPQLVSHSFLLISTYYLCFPLGHICHCSRAAWYRVSNKRTNPHNTHNTLTTYYILHTLIYIINMLYIYIYFEAIHTSQSSQHNQALRNSSLNGHVCKYYLFFYA